MSAFLSSRFSSRSASIRDGAMAADKALLGEKSETPAAAEPPSLIGQRYKAVYSPSETEIYASDIYTAAPVMLHIYEKARGCDPDSLMTEADTLALLEELEPPLAEVPEMLDAHIASSKDDPLSYIALRCHDGISLCSYMKLIPERKGTGNDTDGDRPGIKRTDKFYLGVVYDALCAVIGTVKYALSHGVSHNMLSEECIFLVSDDAAGLRVFIEGYGRKIILPADMNFSADSDITSLMALVRRATALCRGSKDGREYKKKLRSLYSELEGLKASYINREKEGGAKKNRVQKKLYTQQLYTRQLSPSKSARRQPFPALPAAVAMLAIFFTACGYIIFDRMLLEPTSKSVPLEIPQLTGMIYEGYDGENGVYTVKDPATNLISELNAEYFRVTVNYRDDNSIPNGTVILQRPSPHSLRKSIPGLYKSQIELTVSRTQTAIEIENLVGFNSDEAEQMLVGRGAKVSKIIRYNNKIPKGIVYCTAPSAYESINPGDTVILYISGGNAT